MTESDLEESIRIEFGLLAGKDYAIGLFKYITEREIEIERSRSIYQTTRYSQGKEKETKHYSQEDWYIDIKGLPKVFFKLDYDQSHLCSTIIFSREDENDLGKKRVIERFEKLIDAYFQMHNKTLH